MSGIPPVRRRLVGAALRRYREGLGYGLEDAARVLECDRSKISRIETGHRGIRGKELRELLTDYGVPGGEQEALAAVAHQSREQGWWRDFKDVLGGPAEDFAILETAAAEILAYEPHRVPALLQTRAYARAVADADPAFSDDARREQAADATLARQRMVLKERKPRLEVVLSEGALHQSVGGPAVMRTQLARLAAVAGSEAEAAITLRVLPFAAGAHAAAGCGTAILRFALARRGAAGLEETRRGAAGPEEIRSGIAGPEETRRGIAGPEKTAPDIGIVHLGGLSGGVSLDGPEELNRYLRAFAQLRLAALNPAASARLLRDMARD